MMIRIWSFDKSSDLCISTITHICGDQLTKVSWFVKLVDCGHSLEKLIAYHFIIMCNVFTIDFVFYDIAVPRLSPWHVTCVYMSWLRDIYIPKMSLPNLHLPACLCYFVAWHMTCVYMSWLRDIYIPKMLLPNLQLLVLLRCVTWMKSWIYWVYWRGCLMASP